MKSISDKQKAKRLAAGETFLVSTIRRVPLKQKEIVRSGPHRKRAPRPSQKPIAKRSRKRRLDDARIYGPKEFRDYLHAHECLGCGYRGEAIQQAHVQTGGMGRKDDWTRTGPLCGPHLVYWYAIGEGRSRIIAGCHAEQGAAKRSWRTRNGETFAAAQGKFFAEWAGVDYCHYLGTVG